MVILSKGCKRDNFQSHNFLKLSFTNNIRGLRSNFVECESFLESYSPDILDSDNFSVRGYLPLIQKDYYSYAWASSSCEKRIYFSTGLISRKLCGILLKFSTSFPSLSVFLLFPLSITFFVVMHGFLFYFI